jgi:hypothetical protein
MATQQRLRSSTRLLRLPTPLQLPSSKGLWSNFQKAPQGVLFALKKKWYHGEVEEKQSKSSRIIEIETQARERTTNLILAGFGFVAGLAWNEAIKSLIDTLFVIEKDSLLAKFIYAIVVTILVVIVSYFFSKLNTPKK